MKNFIFLITKMLFLARGFMITHLYLIIKLWVEYKVAFSVVFAKCIKKCNYCSLLTDSFVFDLIKCVVSYNLLKVVIEI